MLAFQIVDDYELILEKILKRNPKMLILGIDDHGLMWQVITNANILPLFPYSQFEIVLLKMAKSQVG